MKALLAMFAAVGLLASGQAALAQDAAVATPATPGTEYATTSQETSPAAWVDPGPACNGHYAQWPYSDEAPTPAGTWTRMRTCMVGGHQVRINIGSWPTGTYRCGAADATSQISVWVDGVKVVSRRDAGLGALCFDSNATLVTKVIFNDRMHLTVCEVAGATQRGTPYSQAQLQPGETGVNIYSDQGQEDEYFVQTCKLTTITPPAGAKDPYFDVRTPPGIVLQVGEEAICPSIQASFAQAYRPPSQQALEPYLTNTLTLNGTPFDTASDDDKAAGKVSRYRLDIDHDGSEDILSFADKRDTSGMEYPGQYTWTSGASGQTYGVTGRSLKTGIGWTTDLYVDPIRDDLTFIEAGGKFWLYRASVGLLSSFPAYDVEEVETMQGAIDEGADPEGTRWLYALQPDGTARVACQWTARKRPEEFM